MTILINSLTIEDINAALLRLQRAMNNEKASLSSKVTNIVSGSSKVNGNQYNDSQLRALIQSLQEITSEHTVKIESLEKEVNPMKEKLSQMSTLLANISLTYNDEDNILTFTNSQGKQQVYQLKDTTYTFSFDTDTQTFTIHNDLDVLPNPDYIPDSEEPQYIPDHTNDFVQQIIGTTYTFTFSNGILTIHNNLDSTVADTTISFDNRYYTKTEIDALVLSITTRLTSIESKIPTEATSENKLADKNWVSSQISVAAATFRGTFNSLADLNAYSGPKDKNDYAFVKTSTGYDQYKYVEGTGWTYEFSLETLSGSLKVQADTCNHNVYLAGTTLCSGCDDITTLCGAPNVYFNPSTGSLNSVYLNQNNSPVGCFREYLTAAGLGLTACCTYTACQIVDAILACCGSRPATYTFAYANAQNPYINVCGMTSFAYHWTIEKLDSQSATTSGWVYERWRFTSCNGEVFTLQALNNGTSTRNYNLQRINYIPDICCTGTRRLYVGYSCSSLTAAQITNPVAWSNTGPDSCMMLKDTTWDNYKCAMGKVCSSLCLDLNCYTANADRPILVACCYGIQRPGVSTVCPLTFNPSTGLLKTKTLSLTGYAQSLNTPRTAEYYFVNTCNNCWINVLCTCTAGTANHDLTVIGCVIYNNTDASWQRTTPFKIWLRGSNTGLGAACLWMEKDDPLLKASYSTNGCIFYACLWYCKNTTYGRITVKVDHVAIGDIASMSCQWTCYVCTPFTAASAITGTEITKSYCWFQNACNAYTLQGNISLNGNTFTKSGCNISLDSFSFTNLCNASSQSMAASGIAYKELFNNITTNVGYRNHQGVMSNRPSTNTYGCFGIFVGANDSFSPGTTCPGACYWFGCSGELRSNCIITTSALNLLKCADNECYQIIDLTSSCYCDACLYPVHIPMTTYIAGSVGNDIVHIKVNNRLNTNKPSWATHNNGFTAVADFYDSASGWGTASRMTWANAWQCSYHSGEIMGYCQMTHSSFAVLYLRGGACWRVWNSTGRAFTPHCTSFTSNNQTVSPIAATGSIPKELRNGWMCGNITQSECALCILKCHRTDNINYPLAAWAHAANTCSYNFQVDSAGCSFTMNPYTGVLSAPYISANAWCLNCGMHSCQLPLNGNTKRYYLICYDSARNNGDPEFYFSFFSMTGSINTNRNVNYYCGSCYGAPCFSYCGYSSSNCNCFWITYQAYWSPHMCSNKRFQVICTTDTAPSGVTFYTFTNINAVPGTVDNATCFNGYTWAQALACFTSTLTTTSKTDNNYYKILATDSNGGIVQSGCAGLCYNPSMNYICANVTCAYCSCCVHLDNFTASASRCILVASGTGMQHIGASTSCPLTFNPYNGVFSTNIASVNALCSCYIVTYPNCLSLSLTANCEYWIKIGQFCSYTNQSNNKIDINFNMGGGNNVVDNLRLVFDNGATTNKINSMAIEAHQTQYSGYGIQGFGLVWGSVWNCYVCVYAKVKAYSTGTYQLGLHKNLIDQMWSTSMTCVTAPTLCCFICTKPNGIQAFHYWNGLITGLVTAACNAVNASYAECSSYATCIDVPYCCITVPAGVKNCFISLGSYSGSEYGIWHIWDSNIHLDIYNCRGSSFYYSYDLTCDRAQVLCCYPTLFGAAIDSNNTLVIKTGTVCNVNACCARTFYISYEDNTGNKAPFSEPSILSTATFSTTYCFSCNNTCFCYVKCRNEYNNCTNSNILQARNRMVIPVGVTSTVNGSIWIE